MSDYWEPPRQDPLLALNAKIEAVRAAVSQISGAIGTLVAVFLVFGAWMLWTKPDCRVGYVPTVLAYTGWGCVAGYRP